MTLSENHVEALEQQLAPGEQVVEHYSSEDRTVAVTDRRILRVTEPREGSENRGTQKVTGVFFTGPQVLGVTVDSREAETVNLSTLLFGGVILAMGVGVSLTAFVIDIMILPGLTILAAGFVVTVFAFNGEDGGIDVTIHTTASDDEEIELPLEAVDLARSIPAEVGAAHGREMTVATA